MGSGSNRGRPGLTWLWLATLLGCSTAARPTRIIMATTTSVEDSGLLQVLVAAFETVHDFHQLRPVVEQDVGLDASGKLAPRQFLLNFLAVGDEVVPSWSILREYIGGSGFEY